MVIDEDVIRAVNAAVVLRRPLLVTGKPGTGKSSLAYAVAHELDLGEVLVWPVTSRSTLQHGLYQYDAIARLQDSSLAEAVARSGEREARPADFVPPPSDIGRYIRLGPLGTAMLASKAERPRVLLIDEVDKSDIDLPNDLLHVFEEGRFDIPELARLPGDADRAISVRPADGGAPISVRRGEARCEAFPIVFLTSNGEREFPPAFLRRCLRLVLREPGREQLEGIAKTRLGACLPDEMRAVSDLIAQFVERRDGKESDGRKQDLATDQLLNAAYLLLHGYLKTGPDEMRELILRPLTEDTGSELDA